MKSLAASRTIRAPTVMANPSKQRKSASKKGRNSVHEQER